MKFELSYSHEPESRPHPWSWQAIVQGKAVFVGPTTYATEAEARSDIAKARKACAAARFAKVVAPFDNIL